MTFLLCLATYLGIGFVLYRRRFPDGLFPIAIDPELDRVRRTSRRRVLPRPTRRLP